MTNNLIELLKQAAPAFPVVGLGLTITFQGLEWYKDDKKREGKQALGWGIVVFVAGLVSLVFIVLKKDVTWIQQMAPAISIWAISLTLLFQGSKLIGKANKNWIGWIAFGSGFILFLVGLLVFPLANSWYVQLGLLIGVILLCIGVWMHYAPREKAPKKK